MSLFGALATPTFYMPTIFDASQQAEEGTVTPISRLRELRLREVNLLA